MTDKLKCPVCGDPTRVYMGNARKDGLCGKHADMLKVGELAKCEKCDAFYIVADGCLCTDNKVASKTVDSKKKCLFCGFLVPDNYLFCKDCYFKYKDKTITVSIKHLTHFQVIDEYGNRDVKTCNGMFVRSQQEKIIYDELYSRRIAVEYEPTLYYKDDKGVIQTLHPDFLLTDYGLYIEHWGYENTKDPKYLESKKFKEKIYKDLGKKVSGTSGDDIKDIKAAIDRIFFENDIEV